MNRLVNRALLRLVNRRLRSDTGDAFMGGLVLSLATRIRERGEEANAQKAVQATITRVTAQIAALDEFFELEAGEVARQ
jgi:hypothetical protein